MECWGLACSSLGDSGHDIPIPAALPPPPLRGYPGYWGGGSKGSCATWVGQVYATCLGQGIPICYSAPSRVLSWHSTLCSPSFNFSTHSPQTALLGWRLRCLGCASVSIPPISAQAPTPSPTQSSIHLISTKRKVPSHCWVAFLTFLRCLSICGHSC